MSKKRSCQGGPCLLNPLELPIVCQECPLFDRGLLRKLKNEFSPLDDIIIEPEPKECPICGTMFFDRANKTYCSPPCCKKAYRLRKLARTSEDKLKVYEWRECIICHSDFYPHTDQQKTCGGKCSEEYMRRTYKRGVGVRSKHLERLNQEEPDSMTSTPLLSIPNFKSQFMRHEDMDYVPIEDLTPVIHYLSANHSWWKSLNLPRQGAMLNMAYSIGIERFNMTFRQALMFIMQCRWTDAKTAILATSWSRQNGARGVELARQIEQGVWQEDPLSTIGKEEEYEQGTLI